MAHLERSLSACRTLFGSLLFFVSLLITRSADLMLSEDGGVSLVKTKFDGADSGAGSRVGCRSDDDAASGRMLSDQDG
jgi:hypothetical protein